MRIPIFVIFLFVQDTIACPSIEGTWKSDHKLTLEYTEKYAKMPEHTFNFINQIVGTAEVTYTKNNMKLKDIPVRKIEIKGKTYDWNGINKNIEFKNLGCTHYSVAIKFSMFDEEFISLLNFVDEDTYWVYMGSPLLEDVSNTREYFVKVKK